MPSCPHGDAACPCRDNGRIETNGTINSDPCHYEGKDAMVCPNMPPWFPYHLSAAETGLEYDLDFDGVGMHCHVEGCRWDVENCGLHRIGVDTQKDPLGVGWACGARRISEWMCESLGLDAEISAEVATGSAAAQYQETRRIVEEANGQ